MRKLDGYLLTISTVAMLFSAAGVSHAQITTVPTGLSPCDPYRLAFVTTTARDGTSPSIGVYNAFVSAAASSVLELAALGTTWTAIASTLTEPSARDNTGTNPDTSTGVPIYRLDDTRLVNDNADLWDVFIAVPIDVDENGGQVDSKVWTGTTVLGFNGGDTLLGANEHVGAVHKVGKTTFTNAAWVDDALGQQSSLAHPLYALSDVLTVPATGSPLRDLCLRVVYGAESIVQGPLSFGLSMLPTSVSATIRLSGFGQTQNVVAGLADLSSFSLRYGDGVWTELTSFALVTDATGEVTTLSYATTAINTPTVVGGGILNNSFSATFDGTDISSGQDIEYFYADSAQTLSVQPPAVPALGPWALLTLACGLAAGGGALVRGGRVRVSAPAPNRGVSTELESFHLKEIVMKSIVSLLFLLVLVGPARAVDGVLEINQTCAEQTGCFSGDSAGFPVRINGVVGRSYRLTSDLVVPDENTHGIEIFTQSISIDLNGFGIARSGCQGAGLNCTPSSGTGSGITVGLAHRGARVHNGSITGMGASGVSLGAQSEVVNLRVRWNRLDGIDGDVASKFTGNLAFENGGSGISALSGSTFSNNTVYKNGDDGIFALDGSTISGNTAYQNGRTGISTGDGSTVSGNTSYRNTQFGMTLGQSCTVTNNVSYKNIFAGIVAGAGSTVSGNTSNENGGSGITALPGSLVRGNTVRLNANHGLFLFSDTAYRENVITGNSPASVFSGINMGGNSCDGTTTCP